MKILSKNNVLLKVIPIIIISLIVSFIIYELLKNFFILLGLLTLSITWIYRKYAYSYDLYYTDEDLILENKRVKRKISLSDIRGLKKASGKTRVMGYQFYEYDLFFKNESGELETVNFYVSSTSFPLKEFQTLLEKFNLK